MIDYCVIPAAEQYSWGGKERQYVENSVIAFIKCLRVLAYLRIFLFYLK